MTNINGRQKSEYLSEIIPLEILNPNLICFSITPDIEKETGNRLSYQFSIEFPDVAVIWHQPDKLFWGIGKQNKSLPTRQDWKEALERIKNQVEDFQDSLFAFQWEEETSPNPKILAELASRILKKERAFSNNSVFKENDIEVEREVIFWSETLELNGQLTPALTLTVKSNILYKDTLADFYEKNSDGENPEKLLIGLKVRSLDKDSSGNIIKLIGDIKAHRQELIVKTTGSISKKALENAPDNQPVIGVRFNKGTKEYHYAMAAFRPCLTPETAERFNVDYGKFLKKTKMDYSERQKFLILYNKEAKNTLKNYGFSLNKSVNSRQYPSLFWTPKVDIENTELLFGNNYSGAQNRILIGLKKGGVFRYHSDYDSQINFNNSNGDLPKIYISAIKLIDIKASKFINDVKTKLKGFGFQGEVTQKKEISTENKSISEIRAEVEVEIKKMLATPTNLFLVFLPQSDRDRDNSEEGSYYQQIYDLLLNRQVASQFIYENTLKSTDNYSNILNNVIPGILAKLGNIPFVLKQPLSIADCFIGLDISRRTKQYLPGTRNACASIRLYDNRGAFISYRLEGDLIEGERIPLRLLEKILPADKLGGKTVLIYRDGRFVHGEVDNILARGELIKSRFILVECRKSRIPRLYDLKENNSSSSKTINSPTKGLALRLSSHEAIIITTDVKSHIGVPRPLRLKIHEKSFQVSIESVVDTTLKLTLLHHGSLKTPRLPMPLYGADAMSELRLNGIYSQNLEGDRQFWL